MIYCDECGKEANPMFECQWCNTDHCSQECLDKHNLRYLPSEAMPPERNPSR